MNLELATGPLAQAVGWALLHLLWQGALVAVLLAVTTSLLAGRSAHLRYALSCAALLAVVGLGIATGIRTYASADAPLASLAPATLSTSPSNPVVASRMPAATTPGADRLGELARAANDALPALVTLWMAGVALFSTRLLFEWLRARRLVARSTRPASEAWQEAARRLAVALGVRRAVRLFESTAVAVPSVIGFVRPAILLPASVLSGLTPAQFEMILAHELAHIRRHDFLVNLLQAVVETLLFYHPAVWWISRRIREEREHCCDDLAVAVCGSPLQYARALTRLEELRARPLALAASANGGSLFERVRRIAGGPSRPPGAAVRGAAALSALAVVLVALAGVTVPAIGERKPGGTKAAVERVRPAVSGQAMGSAMLGVPAGPVLVSAATPGSADAKAGDPEDVADVTPPDDGPDAGIDPRDDTEPAPDVVGNDSNLPSLDDLIALRSQGVTTDDVHVMRALFPGVSLKEIASMAAVGVTPDYVREMRRAGLEVRTASEASGLAGVGVTPKYLREMRSAGLEVRNASEAQGLAGVGVTPEYIREMRAAGLEVRHANQAQGLAGVGVTGAYVRELRAAGIPVKSAEQAQGLAGVGVTPDYVRRMRRAGIDLDRAEEAQGLSALGITPEFVERLSRAGYTNLTVEQLQRLGAAGLTGDDFVREMSKYRSR